MTAQDITPAGLQSLLALSGYAVTVTAARADGQPLTEQDPRIVRALILGWAHAERLRFDGTRT